jgi:hypothetical protein
MSDTNKNQIEQHSLLKSLILHLLPAVIWIFFYIPLARLAVENGIPTMLVMLIVSVFTLFAFQFGYIYALGRKRNGRLSLQGIVLYREKLPWLQYAYLGVAVAAWQFLVAIVGFDLNEFIRRLFFSWIPDWYYLSRGAVGQNAPSVEISIAVLSVLIFGIIGPISEELYFRGYLLPRLSNFGAWAPLLNTVFFILYHFWQIHLIIPSVIGFLPMVYFVWRKRSIYLGIIVHCSLNLIGQIIWIIERLR